MSNSRGVRSDDQELVEQVAPHVYKVCPPASELRAPAQKDVPCPVIDCNKVCKQPSALRFHLERVHKIYRVSSVLWPSIISDISLLDLKLFYADNICCFLLHLCMSMYYINKCVCVYKCVCT